MNKITVENFVSIPSRNKRGPKADPVLDQIRALQPLQRAVISFDSTVSAKDKVRSLSSKLHKVGNLDFSPAVRVNEINNTIEIYREIGSDWAKDANGDFVRSSKNHRLTVTKAK